MARIVFLDRADWLLPVERELTPKGHNVLLFNNADAAKLYVDYGDYVDLSIIGEGGRELAQILHSERRKVIVFGTEEVPGIPFHNKRDGADKKFLALVQNLLTA